MSRELSSFVEAKEPKPRDEETEMIKRTEEFFEAKSEAVTSIDSLASEVKGKKVVLYGPSWAGKTTLAIHLASKLGKTLYIDSDMNFPVMDLAKRLKADLIYKQAKSFEQAFYLMRSTTADAVIIDSLSGLMGHLIDRLRPGNPRITLLSAQLQDQLVRLCRSFNTSIIVTHVGADFKRGERIRINQALLRYIDVIIKVDYDAEGKRYVSLQRRIPVETPEFTFQAL